MNTIHDQVKEILVEAGISGEIELASPPQPEMGDLAFGCFALAKEEKKNPAEVAAALADKIQTGGLVSEVKAAGPYVNFYLDGSIVAGIVLGSITADFGAHTIGNGKSIAVEYACTNPMKVFHLGHLRNLVTGEAVVRMFENAGYDVKRVNYQGDVGRHIAMSLWGIEQHKDEFNNIQTSEGNLRGKISFLGAAYAYGATKFEEDEQAKAEILEYNKKVYQKDPEIADTYEIARAWSLEYFETIYAKLGSHFARLYFESEVFESGQKLVEEGLKKGIFKKSDGAIIFEGSKHGLHDRVFINSEGYPTYEAKEMGLGQMHFDDLKPDQVIHVVGKEQREYFQVVFKALAQLFPETEGKEYHLVGGYLQLKGDKKMSSRKGNVVSGDELVDLVEERVREIMKDADLENKDAVARAVAVAALKYSMLKVGASQDMAFDMNESVSTQGDSGPYLLYIVARIRSILEKAGVGVASDKSEGMPTIPKEIAPEEKDVLLMLASYPRATLAAVESYDPSVIAKYVYGLAQSFNRFYNSCPVVGSEEEVKMFRVALIQAVEHVMKRGLHVLGIETVEKM